MKKIAEFDKKTFDAIAAVFKREKETVKIFMENNPGWHMSERHYVGSSDISHELGLEPSQLNTSKCRRSLDRLFKKGRIAKSTGQCHRWTLLSHLDLVYDPQNFEVKGYST